MNALCRSLGVEPLGVSRSGDWIRGDVSSWGYVEALVAQHRPEFVFHLAANSTTRHGALFENHAAICTGALNILEAVKTHCPASKVFLSGSGLQFHNEGKPISERDSFEASSPYSLARIHSVYAARYYRTLGLKTYVGYFFHHDSPLRKEHHVSQMIAQASKRIGEGSGEMLEMGDVSVEKEWTFAGDVVEGIWALVQQERVFEATIGSGLTYSIEEWLDECFSLVGKQWKDHVRLRENFTPEYSRLVSDSSTMHALGWKPRVSLRDLARLMVLGEEA
ncbi:GDP-mannose 4,6-dehydratase [Abditibacteriota bacterium]|nr:GDP-mannose 4,6-dehydratase [Abditibacteriota bacterium]